MYTLVSAIGRSLAGNKRWTSISIGDMPISNIFSTYSKVIATLSSNFMANNVAIDLDTIRVRAGGLSITFNEFLVLNANTTLTPLDNIPSIETKYLKYADAFHANYKVVPVNASAAIDSKLPIEDKTWLHLSKDNVDYKLFYESCLVNINGFFHLTDYDKNGIYVKDGMKSKFISGYNQIGICSFRELGKLTHIPIKKEMIYKQQSNLLYRKHACVDIGIDVSDKTVMLVLGGYLHILDTKTLVRVNKSMFIINFKDIPIIDRYYESKNYIDLSSLKLDVNDRNPEAILQDELLSDEAILAYLTLSQSFFVILDNPNIWKEKEYIRNTPYPNMFISYTKPDKPLVVGNNKVTNYWYVPEDGQYSINCVDTLKPNYIYNTVDTEELNQVSNAREPGNPLRHSMPYYLVVGCDNLVY